ncbi:MAG: carboxypeptidase-like regulatory domain-containing protein [Thermoplasmata archaeon]
MMAALCASSVFAQTTANVSGHVYDESNHAPVSGADIYVKNTDTSEDYHFTTGDNGYFNSNLPLGNYHVEVTADDYFDWSQDFSIEDTTPQTNNIYLTPENWPGHENPGENTGGDNEDGGFDMPFGDMDEEFITTMLTLLISLVVIFFICLITITIALVAMFVRLGKIRKELAALNEAQKPRAQAPPVQYQQPPPPPME